MERQRADAESEAIINPMVAASSRLVAARGQLALARGINTVPGDGNVRHQKGPDDAHRREQWGGDTNVEDLVQPLVRPTPDVGRARLRGAAPGRRLPAAPGVRTIHGSRRLRHVPPVSAQGTHRRKQHVYPTGGVAPIETSDYGYMVVFTTDRSPDANAADWGTVVGTLDLAGVRVRRDFASMDSAEAASSTNRGAGTPLAITR